jgi:hypothetical protein
MNKLNSPSNLNTKRECPGWENNEDEKNLMSEDKHGRAFNAKSDSKIIWVSDSNLEHGINCIFKILYFY